VLDVAMMHLLLLSIACSDGKGTTPYEDDSAGDDSDSTPPSTDWTVTQISDDNIGLQNVIESAPDGTLTLLTWDNGGTTKGVCKKGKTPQQRYTLHYATESGGSWSFEDVDAPAVAYDPTGAGLAWDSSGNALVAYNGGEPTGILCGADDMILATRTGGSWTSSTVEADSGESATGEPASDAGYVVGSYPAIAVDPASGMIATVFKDTHFGSLQHDDQYRADLEYAASSGGGGWTKEAADIGEGAGDRSQLVFDAQGRPVAVYSIPVQEEDNNRFGLWASRREKDGTWSAIQLHTGSVGSKISLTTAPTGEIVVAIYSASDKAVKIRTLTDPDNFTLNSSWTSELVASNRYDEGEYVSLAYTPDGRRAMAYRRCKLLTDEGNGCNINDEAVVFALEGKNGFEMESVKAGDEGACGEWASMAIDATGKATILFRCTVEDSGSYDLRLFTATRML
jgi:hypothetical protein